MKRNINELALEAFLEKSAGIKYISNSGIADFYSSSGANLSGADLRRIVYGLEKEGILTSSGSGVFDIQDVRHKAGFVSKKRFEPVLSKEISGVKEEISKTFPFIQIVFWETRILHEFMIQQPNINLILLECEKGTDEAVFAALNGSKFGPVYLNPDRTLMERYVLLQPEALLVSRLISRSPKIGNKDRMAYAKIEKILVDLLVDEDRFYMYQGSELANIFEAVFTRYLINQDSLITYAKRRHAEDKLKEFILTKTNLELRIFSKGEKYDLSTLKN
jgi:hypothetical protein